MVPVSVGPGTLWGMDISTSSASAMLRAVRARSVPGGGVFGPVVMAAASVLNDPVDENTPGVSWRDEAGRFNALLRVGGKLIHALVPKEGAAHATVHTSFVSAVEAADVVERETGFGGGPTWRVGAWHVTLQDGTVITLSSSDTDHAETIAGFVREHLLP